MQVCVITALKIKGYKRKIYSFVIMLNIVRLIQIQSRVVSTRVVSGPLNTCRDMQFPCNQQRVPKTPVYEKEALCGNSSYLQNRITLRA
jgi:hypothetical protein